MGSAPANPTDSTIVARLRQHRSRLAAGPAPVPFRLAVWQRALVGHPAAAGLATIAAGSLNPTVSRDDLRKLSAAAQRAGAPARRLEELFVAVMVWGSGTSNGRGPRNTAAALGDPRLPSTLAATAGLVRAGSPGIAYTRFAIRGVGPPFLTKWLWVAGAPFALVPRPLVLDSRVWAALGALGWNSITAARSRRHADRYVAYLEALDRWSALLPAESERLEWLLFDRADQI